MMNGIFITGTDTGVGKTYIGTAIARSLVQQGIQVVPRKPIESGCSKQGDELVAEDALALKNAASYPGELNEVCPYPFEAAISPQRAARLENRPVTIDELQTACLHNIDRNNDFLLVEGAGGFYSPLCENGLNADLAQQLQLPVLLVAEDRLGTINHILLTLEAIKTRKLGIAAVILNQIYEAETEHMDNLADLQELAHCPVYRVSTQAKNDAIHPEKLATYLSSAFPKNKT